MTFMILLAMLGLVVAPEQSYRVLLEVSWGAVQDLTSGVSIETHPDGRLKLPGCEANIVTSFGVVSTDGSIIRSNTYRGRVLLLDFWATWCAPCVGSLAHVDALAREYSRNLAVVGINVDETERARARKELSPKPKSAARPVN
jgi:thiol-disulfide isomerase/thioredoxin